MNMPASIALLNKQASQVFQTLSEQIESVISGWAARGLEEIGGPAVGQMVEAGSTAMQSLYEQAVSIAPTVASTDASTFMSAFDSTLNSIALSAMSRAPSGSGPELSATRQHLVHQLQLKLPQSGRGG